MPNPVTDEFEAARAEHQPLARAGNDHHFIVFLIDSIRALRAKQSAPGWHRDAAGNVVITMTPGDYDNLLLHLGASASALNANGVVPLSRSLALVNRLNAGNPHYTPYEVKCHWCAEGRPFIPGQEGVQHVPLYAGGEHGGAMCYNSAIYNRDDDASTNNG